MNTQTDPSQSKPTSHPGEKPTRPTTSKESRRLRLEAFKHDWCFEGTSKNSLGLNQYATTIQLEKVQSFSRKVLGYGLSGSKKVSSWDTSLTLRESGKTPKDLGIPMHEITQEPNRSTKPQWETHISHWFLSCASEKQLPFFKVLVECNKNKIFEWTDDAKGAFQDLKIFLTELPTLTL
ncbi:hypothetical protein Tco_0944830 [Tanacetum coccineum]